MRFSIFYALGLGSILLLAGCYLPAPQVQQPSAEQTEATKKLSEAADRLAQAAEDLARAAEKLAEMPRQTVVVQPSAEPAPQNQTPTEPASGDQAVTPPVEPPTQPALPVEPAENTEQSGDSPRVMNVPLINDKGEKITKAGKLPAPDDTLLLYYGDDPDTLNLLTSSDNVSTAFQRQVYESFADRNMADPSIWEPSLAESWEFDPEKTEYTIHLRKGVMWHPIKLPNGNTLEPKEVTTRDVKFTFDCILNPFVEAPHMRSYYIDPAAETEEDQLKIEVTIVDKYTFKVRWKKPYFMADTFTLGTAPIPRHVYSVDENGEPISLDFSSQEFAEGFNNHWANTKMCGTGPMIFKEWDKANRVVLERNPDYWGNPFYFSRIEYRYQANPNTAIQQALQRELDWAAVPEKDRYLQLEDHPEVTGGNVRRVEYPITGYRYIGYNLRKPIFQDKQVRMALSLAVPVEKIIHELYYDLAIRTTGPFVPGGPFANPDCTPLPYDLEKARQLLEQAGWTDTDQDGIRDKEIDGVRVPLKFDMMIFSNSQQYLSLAEMVKDSFAQIGVQISITPTEWALMLQRLRKREFDATILGWGSDWKGDPFQIWHSSQADLPDSSNHVAYQDPEVDRLIEELRVTMDEGRQIELYHQIHRKIYDDQPYTFLYCDIATALINARIENVKFYSQLRPFMDQREWWTTSPRILGK